MADYQMKQTKKNGNVEVQVRRKLEGWILKNYIGAPLKTFNPPKDWKRDREVFFVIEGYNYRVNFTDIPDNLLTKDEQHFKQEMIKGFVKLPENINVH